MGALHEIRAAWVEATGAGLLSWAAVADDLGATKALPPKDRFTLPEVELVTAAIVDVVICYHR